MAKLTAFGCHKLASREKTIQVPGLDESVTHPVRVVYALRSDGVMLRKVGTDSGYSTTGMPRVKRGLSEAEMIATFNLYCDRRGFDPAEEDN